MRISYIANKVFRLLHAAKKWLGGAAAASTAAMGAAAQSEAAATPDGLAPGDRIRGRSRAEIQATLDEWNRLNRVRIV